MLRLRRVLRGLLSPIDLSRDEQALYDSRAQRGPRALVEFAVAHKAGCCMRAIEARPLACCPKQPLSGICKQLHSGSWLNS